MTLSPRRLRDALVKIASHSTSSRPRPSDGTEPPQSQQQTRQRARCSRSGSLVGGSEQLPAASVARDVCPPPSPRRLPGASCINSLQANRSQAQECRPCDDSAFLPSAGSTPTSPTSSTSPTSPTSSTSHAVQTFYDESFRNDPPAALGSESLSLFILILVYVLLKRQSLACVGI